jgi:hypothetical protein
MRRLSLTLAAAFVVFFLASAWAAAGGQKRQSVTIPSGTQIQVRLSNQLHTGETQSGQSFSGTVVQPVVVGGRTLLGRGATVHGRVTEVVSSGRLKRPASITLELMSVRTEALRIDGKSHLLRNAALIGGGAAAGALVGGAVGGKKGAAVGAVVGAGAGTTTAYVTGKKEIVLPAETVLTFVVGGTGGTAPAAAASRVEPKSGEASEAAEAYGGEQRGGARERVRETAQALLFTERDQHVIRSYYGGGRGLPPGLAKRGGHLPPGLERQLQRNGTLPPGLQKRVEPFPVELEQQLPRLPSGCSRVIVAGRALILDRNNKILDLLVLVR